MALGQNDCGPQYRSAAAPPAAAARLLRDRCSAGAEAAAAGNADAPFGSGDLTPSDQSSTFRTICVRTCDGFYFPVSYSTTQAKFRDDEQACQRMCPAAEVMLFTYRNPGEDVSQAVSISGQPYTSLPNAFKYRQEFNAACSCKRPGESWAEALKHLDDTTVERGDIVVTDETVEGSCRSRRPEPGDARAGKQTRAGDPPGPRAPQRPRLRSAPTASAGRRSLRRPRQRRRQRGPPTARSPSAPLPDARRNARSAAGCRAGPPFAEPERGASASRSAPSAPPFMRALTISIQKSNASLLARSPARSPASGRASAAACRDRGSGW